MAGLSEHDAYLTQFAVSKVYVPSHRFMNFLLDKRGGKDRYKSITIQEVGLPYAKYPLFSEFSADWIIAAPTLFSFYSESGKQQYLGAVNQLLSQIPLDQVIVYKPHNGNKLDYFTPRLHYYLASWFTKIPMARRVMLQVRRLSWSWLCLQIDRVETCILHQVILRRAIPMAEISPYAGISLEAFLPRVRKGVIGGLSNTIWGALYFDIPFYNCVDSDFRRGHSQLLTRRSDALLDLNLEYFGVPFCRGDKTVDVRNQGIVLTHEREGDLVKAILSDLTHVSSFKSTD
jgi:hypothetical protein